MDFLLLVPSLRSLLRLSLIHIYTLTAGGESTRLTLDSTVTSNLNAIPGGALSGGTLPAGEAPSETRPEPGGLEKPQ